MYSKEKEPCVLIFGANVIRIGDTPVCISVRLGAVRGLCWVLYLALDQQSGTNYKASPSNGSHSVYEREIYTACICLLLVLSRVLQILRVTDGHAIYQNVTLTKCTNNASAMLLLGKEQDHLNTASREQVTSPLV